MLEQSLIAHVAGRAIYKKENSHGSLNFHSIFMAILFFLHFCCLSHKTKPHRCIHQRGLVKCLVRRKRFELLTL